MNKPNPTQKTILAWMQPGASRRQQILTVTLVPLQPGIPRGLAGQVMDQQAGKLHHLLEKEMKEEPAARDDLINRLDSIGLLPDEANDRGLNPWELCKQLVDGNPELRAYLKPHPDELKEIPGARKLYKNLTLYQWLDALDDEVSGR